MVYGIQTGPLKQASRMGNTLGHLVWEGAPISRLRTSLSWLFLVREGSRGAKVKRTGPSENS